MYVTDRVLADVHSRPEAGGALLRRLPTGSPVTVLGRSGRYINVRLADGTDGWMKGSKLQEQRPAQMLLLALSEQQDRMAAQLRQLKTELAELRERESRRVLPRLLEHELTPWGIVAAFVVVLIIGVVIGIAWLDYRIRERHGGFRV